MAYRLVLTHAMQAQYLTQACRNNGMRTLLLTHDLVGPTTACPNLEADVRLIQSLLAIVNVLQAGVRIPLPSPSGTFDCVTAFWLYYTQMRWLSGHHVTNLTGPPDLRNAVVYHLPADFSLATRGGGFILNLNVWANQQNPTEWQALEAAIPAHQQAGVPPTLAGQHGHHAGHHRAHP